MAYYYSISVLHLKECPTQIWSSSIPRPNTVSHWANPVIRARKPSNLPLPFLLDLECTLASTTNHNFPSTIASWPGAIRESRALTISLLERGDSALMMKSQARPRRQHSLLQTMAPCEAEVLFEVRLSHTFDHLKHLTLYSRSTCRWCEKTQEA
jgi:hypothetical protein